MAKHAQFDIEIDKLTKSVENAVSGDSFKTEIMQIFGSSDLKNLKKTDWLFDWKEEIKRPNTSVFKLIIADNPNIIQGLISLQDRKDHIFMALIESAKFNKGKRKIYLGVPGNLVAYACKLSSEMNYGGFVSFESKSKLKEHYEKTLRAYQLFGNIMAIDSKAASELIDQYFP